MQHDIKISDDKRDNYSLRSARKKSNKSLASLAIDSSQDLESIKESQSYIDIDILSEKTKDDDIYTHSVDNTEHF